MKILSLIISCSFTLLFLFSTPQSSYAAYAANDHALINLIIVPKKAKKKKGNWKEKIGLPFLQKYIEKRIKKLPAKEAKKRVSTSVNKNKKRQTHPLSTLSATIISAGILLALSIGYLSLWASLLVPSLAGLTSVITGIAALAKIKKNPEQYKGKKWAIAGITLAILTLLYTTGVTLFLLSF